MPPVIALDMNDHGIRPHINQRANTSSPLGSPAGTLTLSSTPNTIVKITIVARGFSSDHSCPRAVRLYLPRTSRSVRLTTSSRDEARSRREVRKGTSTGSPQPAKPGVDSARQPQRANRQCVSERGVLCFGRLGSALGLDRALGRGCCRGGSGRKLALEIVDLGVEPAPTLV